MPKVERNTLILITGFIWLAASIILIRRAYGWLNILTDSQIIIGTLISLPLAIVKSYFIFHKLNTKNIIRIQSFKAIKVNIWEFHVLKDKLLIIIMIITGVVIRHIPFIPKFTLFPIYLGIGLAMFYVWSLYLITFLDEKKIPISLKQ